MIMKNEGKYILEVSCPDCTGEDPQGCFGGDVDQEYFDDLEEAIKSGEKSTNDGIWEYRILDANTGEELPAEIINPAFRKIYGYDYK